jgi:asparagine synthase (glutamine-hydrolysing)
MCGIVGFLGSKVSSASDGAVVLAMSNRLRHRGPDDGGIWIDSEAGIALAQRRLAVVDISPAGHQPMFSQCGRFVIVFNGEIYNHKEVRSSLETEGIGKWRGSSDTEVLLAAIAKWGLKRALALSVGMFALAIWDRRERKLTLARDRLGEKPLYFGWIGKDFVFASEMKAFAAHPEWQPTIDRDAVALMMRYGYVPAPYSIYKGFQKLRPGQYLTVSVARNEVNTDTYWSAQEVATAAASRPFAGTPSEGVAELDSLLRQSIAGQMIADVPLGAFLSGGIDSATIVAVMQSLSTQPVRTYTIGFNEESHNEAVSAKAVAKLLGTDHTELYISSEQARDVIPSLPEIYCEPFADSSQIPTYLVSRLARQSVTVALSGDGGDELFSGYTRYALADQLWNMLSTFPVSVRRAAAKFAKSCPTAVYDAVGTPISMLMPRRHRKNTLGRRINNAAGLLALEKTLQSFIFMFARIGGNRHAL